MNRSVYDVLSSLPGAREDGPVFRRRDGAAWGDVRTAFEHACKRAKITDFRFYDLRHTCASWLTMRGRSLKEVQEILGHREFGMTSATLISAPTAYARQSPRSKIFGTIPPINPPMMVKSTPHRSQVREALERRGSSVAEQLIRNQ
jgi:integrase